MAPPRPRGWPYLEPTATAILVSFEPAMETIAPDRATLAAVRRAVETPGATPAEVARAIDRDPNLAGALLRVVSSPLLGLGERFTSVRHAANVLGVPRIADLVSTAAAIVTLDRARAVAPRITRHTVAVAAIARSLAPAAGTSPDDTFTAALLRHVGLLLLVKLGDSEVDDWITPNGALVERSPHEETAEWGIDHATLGAWAAMRWEIPTPLPEVIAYHHDWEEAQRAGSVVSQMVAAIEAAEILYPEVERAEILTIDRYQDLSNVAALDHLGLTFVELHNMWAGLRRAVRTGKAMLRTPERTPSDRPRPLLPAPAPRPKKPRRALLAGALALALAGAAITGARFRDLATGVPGVTAAGLGAKIFGR